jgi:DNA invertase Pin-like site-specific DNA recombinase
MARQRVIGYLRVSTEEQRHGAGLEVQEQAIRAYCRENQLRLVDVLADEGVSGSNGLDSRLGLAEVLARMERGEASAVIVYRLDRLARDLLLQETTVARLRQQGLSVLSVTEADIDSDDPTRVLVRQVLGAISQYERALIRGRMAAGKAAKKAKGGYAGGAPRYGTRAAGGELVEDPEERQVVEMVERLRSGPEPASYRAICAALTEAGMKTKKGGPWQPAVVRRIAERAGV